MASFGGIGNIQSGIKQLRVSHLAQKKADKFARYLGQAVNGKKAGPSVPKYEAPKQDINK